MIIGSKNINHEDLRKASHSLANLTKFSDSLVPPPFNKIMAIVYNQRYYTALLLRTLRGMDSHKVTIIDQFLDGVRMNGSVNKIIDITEVLSQVDLEQLVRALFREQLNAYELHKKEMES